MSSVIPCKRGDQCNWPACAADCDGRPGHENSPPGHVCAFDGELRCRNCDSTVDENGKWIDDGEFYGTDPDWCPSCDAKMRRT